MLFVKYNHSRFKIAGALLTFLLLYPAGSFAQSPEALDNRLRRLENEIQTMSRALYRGEKPPAEAFLPSRETASQAGLEVRLQQLEAELRDLTGRVESQAYEIRTLAGKLERVEGDLSLRVDELEGGKSGLHKPSLPIHTGGGTSPSDLIKAPNNYTTQGFGGASSNKAPFVAQRLGTLPAESENLKSGGESAISDPATALYESGFSLLKARNYKPAEKAFQSFLDQYPSHPLVANARYWLGETYYVRGEYERAARIFAEGYQNDPKSSKAPDNLLKLALSLGSMGNKEDACVALKQLEKEFAGEKTPVMRHAEQERVRFGCD